MEQVILKKLIVAQMAKKFYVFYEIGSSFLYSHELATGHCSEPNECSPNTSTLFP
jgi:hypothetical protein